MRRTPGVALVAALILLPACGSNDSPTVPAADTTSAGTGMTGATSGNSSTTTRPAPPPGTVQIVDFTFSPRELTVARGEVVTWRNDDPYAHWVVSTTPDVLDTGELSQAQMYSKTFSQAGTYDYYCNIHNYMKASVTVQ
jgi:plastocyanin